ncbi:hypothetical protein AGOR_G00158700 [Albula goreensis]|uniref:Uncharacterized protein n=1 Tax=Albula goreensis TaxID=1534307 RepID=A0A8T3D5F3_9TELE|nr:hypothetical protein AGOR_G00158700 [Albula goreensis]
MGLRLDTAGTLLLLVLTTCICTQAALLRKYSAVDLLTHGRRDKRSTEMSMEDSDSDSDSDSEAEEQLEGHTDYEGVFNGQSNGGVQPGRASNPDSEAIKEEGSGM